MATTRSEATYKSVQEFLAHQREIELKACAKAGSPWTGLRQAAFGDFAADCARLSAEARVSRQVRYDRKYQKDYKNPVDNSYWAMNLHFWPDGRVELWHNQIASSRRVH